MRILLVDDDTMAATIMSLSLEEAGYEVTLAGDGEEALRIVAGNPAFAAIVSDLVMPGIDGIELHRQLEAQGIRAPFVLLSGGNADDLRRRAPGVDACLAKDENIADGIAAAVASVIGAAAR